MPVVNTSSVIVASISSDGVPANNSNYSALSTNGRYVAFTSSTALTPGDTNNTDDAFLFDTATGITRLVSRGLNGVPADDSTPSRVMDVSDDGRYVALSSLADNLVASDPNTSTPDVFVRDMQSGAITRIGAGSVIGLSGDGRYLVYTADTDSVPGDTNGASDIYIRDLFTAQTTIVSQSSAGVLGSAFSSGGSISHDARYVAFGSGANNLVPGYGSGAGNIYLRDRITGVVMPISVNSSEVPVDGSSYSPYVSDDGRYVAFTSYATNLGVADGNGERDVFLRDTVAGTTKLVSVATTGGAGNGLSESHGISADGRYVLFESQASNLVDGDTNGVTDVFVRDIVAGTTTRVSVGLGGIQADGACTQSSFSDDGRYVTFMSASDSLSNGDGNSFRVYRVSLFATAQADNLVGSDGRDVINGGAGDDIISTGRGNDSLEGGTGADTMAGGLGDDVYYVDLNGAGGTGDRVIENAGEGEDTVFVRKSFTLQTGSAIETLRAVSATATTVINLAGNEFSNAVIGNAGANVINGREGSDVLTGLGGKDTFVFDRALSAANVDVITDFTHGVDLIRLDRTFFAKLAVGALPATAFKDVASAAEDANDRILYNHTTGGLFYDADGAGGAAAVRFATLENHPAVITAADFIVVA